jgi:hypothetical protein
MWNSIATPFSSAYRRHGDLISHVSCGPFTVKPSAEPRLPTPRKGFALSKVLYSTTNERLKGVSPVRLGPSSKRPATLYCAILSQCSLASPCRRMPSHTFLRMLLEILNQTAAFTVTKLITIRQLVADTKTIACKSRCWGIAYAVSAQFVKVHILMVDDR